VSNGALLSDDNRAPSSTIKPANSAPQRNSTVCERDNQRGTTIHSNREVTENRTVRPPRAAQAADNRESKSDARVFNAIFGPMTKEIDDESDEEPCPF
jgi:hypothetical protein